jgi:SAM-dependent methyltransferase
VSSSELEARFASLFPGQGEVLSKAEFQRIFGHHGSEEMQRSGADRVARRAGCGIQFFGGDAVYASAVEARRCSFACEHAPQRRHSTTPQGEGKGAIKGRAMGVESERFDPRHFMPPWVRDEHLERFRFASAFVDGRVVVDCACGSGEGTRYFAEAGARRVYAFDVSQEAVDATAEQCGKLPNASCARASALQLPFPSGTADVYISLETIEHLPDDAGLLEEARRVLKPGGFFICSTPNRRVYSPGRSVTSRPWNSFHVREYGVDEFRGLLSQFFSECALYGQNPRSPLRSSVLEFLGKRLPGDAAVRINQVAKLPRFLIKRARQHAVEACRSGREYEYIVAVCKRR